MRLPDESGCGVAYVYLHRFSVHTHLMRLRVQTLLGNKWVKRKWEGPEQFEDEATGLLMMLPTDVVRTQVPHPFVYHFV